jgi:4-hydroxybenzoate polyprenyltransferase
MIEFAASVAGLIGATAYVVRTAVNHWRGFLLAVVPFVGVWSAVDTMIVRGTSWPEIATLVVCGVFWIAVRAIPGARVEIEGVVLAVARRTACVGRWVGQQLG